MTASRVSSAFFITLLASNCASLKSDISNTRGQAHEHSHDRTNQEAEQASGGSVLR